MNKSPKTIRKYNQRAIRKPLIKTTKNIFLHDLKFKAILPKAIYNKLLQSSEFAVSLLNEYIGQPQEERGSLQLMKLALLDQQSIIKELSISMHQQIIIQNTSSVQNPEQHNEISDKQQINQTKQSLNSNNEMNSHTENYFEDNIFLPLDSLINQPKRQYNEDNHDFFHFEERNFATSIPPQEELDILSLID